ncbi:hypothetical protein JNO54_13820 [Janibacter sp. YIM B02568]|uniref:hypothetical protein n=1 Tax=Janibacter endophyticus TaxID=2806261 RepID=UPI00194E38AB|nr:hypothetical protein [Janibacter endophyticus]MBM6547210.1 hypothetical protein [Janibacter endophyticus]
MHPLVLVVSASGGLGASTLAAVVARQAGGILVDGDLEGPGADATLVLEEEPGLRWPDLEGLEGPVDPRRLVARLPGQSPPVLAAAGACRLREGAVRSAVTALREVGPVVVDLPAVAMRGYPWLQECDLTVLLAGLRPRQVRDAEVTMRGLRDVAADVGAVTRGARRAEGVGREVADHLGARWLAHLADDPSVPRDEGCGRAPRSRGRVGLVAREIVALVPPVATGEGGEQRWLRAAG